MIIRQAKELQPVQSSSIDGLCIFHKEYSVYKNIAGKARILYIVWYPYIPRVTRHIPGRLYT